MATKKKTPVKKQKSLKEGYTFYSVHEAYEDVKDGTSHLEDFDTIEEAIEFVDDKLNDNDGSDDKYIVYKNVPVLISEKKTIKTSTKL